MSLSRISEQISKQSDALPPVEEWDPPFCGDIDITIKADGTWLYQGSKISRIRLVKLFASVLKKQDGKYFLVTPVEKVAIQVEKLPFVITSWQWLEDTSTPTMVLTTNLDEQILLDQQTPLELDSEGMPLINVRRNLKASIHRNVFYQWAEISQQKTVDNRQQLYIQSGDIDHVIGEL